MTRSSRDVAPTGIFRRHPYLASGVLVSAALFAGIAVLSRLGLSDTPAHAASHVVGIVAAGLFVTLIFVVWPEPTADVVSRGARYVLLVGVAIFLAGQVLEAAGAFGYEGYRRVGSLARLHDAGALLGPAGLLLAMAGAGFTAVLLLGKRMNLLGSRWLTYGFVATTLAVIAFLIGGFLFGY